MSERGFAFPGSKGGFMISEATIAVDGGNGYLGAPGLYNDSQIVGWKHSRTRCISI
jgi:N-ethylmaleimide reductase